MPKNDTLIVEAKFWYKNDVKSKNTSKKWLDSEFFG